MTSEVCGAYDFSEASLLTTRRRKCSASSGWTGRRRSDVVLALACLASTKVHLLPVVAALQTSACKAVCNLPCVAGCLHEDDFSINALSFRSFVFFLFFFLKKTCTLRMFGFSFFLKMPLLLFGPLHNVINCHVGVLRRNGSNVWNFGAKYFSFNDKIPAELMRRSACMNQIMLVSLCGPFFFNGKAQIFKSLKQNATKAKPRLMHTINYK